MPKKLYILSKEWRRHGVYSGYELLAKYIDVVFKVVKRGFFMPYKLSNFFNKRTKLINYKSKTVSKELSLLFKILKNKTVHVLYGDMDYYYLHYVKSFPFNLRKTTLVATFHHPPYELEKRLNYNRIKVLGALDKIIVMGPNQIPFFEKYTNVEIRFIPHGINLNYFTCNPNNKRLNQILLIGISHRDHKRNIEIIEKVNKIITTQFIIIMLKKYANLYSHLENTVLLTHNISDGDLLRHYQNSKGLLLSLVDCTASNTLLEALACSCPLIINNVGAVKDYIPESSGIPVFETNEIDASVTYIEQLLNDEEFLNEIGVKQRELAKKYDWKIIAKATEDFILQ